MINKKVALGVLGVLLAGGAAYYYYFYVKNKPVESSSDQPDPTQATKPPLYAVDQPFKTLDPTTSSILANQLMNSRLRPGTMNGYLTWD